LKRVAIIGSHGLYANYGGWDQLVKNLAEKKSEDVKYIIFNSSDSAKINQRIPEGVAVKRLKLKASGFEGIFYDFWSILLCYWKVDAILFLGVQGMPLIPFLRIFRKIKIVSNVGGVEWERPKFGFLAKLYLRLCFNLSFIFSDFVILDNKHYEVFEPEKKEAAVRIIPYGGEIDRTLEINDNLIEKYPFLKTEYFLSISRSLEDNQLNELCDSFSKSEFMLVLISNLSNSAYGMEIMRKYNKTNNIVLINGLYNKPELDLIRRKCKAYIHTHTLCGTAPSLVEMIISGVPIISVDRPQNRFTLNDQGFFYSSFSELQTLLTKKSEFNEYIPSGSLAEQYEWNKIVTEYERCF
jgi:glycosyltransferase involved in cell wall biosynthesis